MLFSFLQSRDSVNTETQALSYIYVLSLTERNLKINTLSRFYRLILPIYLNIKLTTNKISFPHQKIGSVVFF